MGRLRSVALHNPVVAFPTVLIFLIAFFKQSERRLVPLPRNPGFQSCQRTLIGCRSSSLTVFSWVKNRVLRHAKNNKREKEEAQSYAEGNAQIEILNRIGNRI